MSEQSILKKLDSIDLCWDCTIFQTIQESVFPIQDKIERKTILLRTEHIRK